MPVFTKKRAPVNLLPKDDEDRTLSTRIISWLLTTFRFLVVVVELLVIVGFLSRFFLDSQNSDLTDEINQKKALIQSYLPFEKQFKFTQARIAVAKNYYEGQTSFSDILTVVTKHIVDGVQLVSVQRTNSSIELHVQGNNEQLIDALTNDLQNESLFSNIQVTTIESTQSDQILATIIGNVHDSTSNQTP